MMHDQPEFIVKGIVEGESGRLHVIGRCGDRPIRVDDRFDCIYRNKPRESPLDAGRPPVRIVEKMVALRVACIHAYQRSLPELGQGMTGSLALEGEGSEQVEAGWFLGSGLSS